MIIRCTNRVFDRLTDENAEHVGEYVHMDELNLIVGQEYDVYGIILREGQIWYLICEEDSDEYPRPHFGKWFDLIDQRIPPGWSLTFENSNAGPVAFLPDTWAADASFLEKLVNGDEKA